jgi:hypothetical protein
VLATARRECDFELVEVDIAGDPELEQEYREWLPVVEIDGERSFVYTVPAQAFRRRIARTKSATNEDA